MTACAEARTTAPDETESVRVSTVYDGDTFRAVAEDGTAVDVRMLGLNAPEQGECFYSEALENATKQLEDVQVDLTDTASDQFGRTLARVWIGSRHLNVEFISSGFAIATSPDDGDPFGEEALAAEREAARAMRGLWGRDVCGASGPLPLLEIEVTSHDPPGPDDERLDREVVEVVNQGDTEVDLSGWVIRDESSRHRFQFPNGTAVAGGSRATVSSADSRWDPGQSPVWNNDGDLALLLDTYGRVVSSERY